MAPPLCGADLVAMERVDVRVCGENVDEVEVVVVGVMAVVVGALERAE